MWYLCIFFYLVGAYGTVQPNFVCSLCWKQKRSKSIFRRIKRQGAPNPKDILNRGEKRKNKMKTITCSSHTRTHTYTYTDTSDSQKQAKRRTNVVYYIEQEEVVIIVT
ncbi:hypothetical protein BDZ91DRAFT_709328 [Kalaharituber pfeilii]|nr:hypothetical protein BDZ91DRAFT_709328 [Kalaharituber pfeilii]